MANEPIRWARVEPLARDKSLAPGLEAQVHDPLWLLGRQWQFGELTADTDLGSAIAAEVTAHVTPLARFRPGRPDDGVTPRVYDVEARPLETLVEAEEARSDGARASARAGQHFERLLAAHGVRRYARAYRAAFPLVPESEPLDAASRRFVTLLAGRAIDGRRLYGSLVATLRPRDGTTPRLPLTPAIAAADADKVRSAAVAWLAWADALVTSAAGHNPSWIADRMEYAFGVDAPAVDGAGLTLEVEEYTDGALDWHAFTQASAAPSGVGESRVVGPLTVVPSAVTYPGMPASRLWEFEDARIDFGGVQADPEDLGRMLVTEFALVYGGDWLLIPLEVPAGVLVRIASLQVRDTFGHTVTVNPTTALEPPSAGWRMFGLSPRESVNPATGELQTPGEGLLVAPTLASTLQGAPIEEVLLLRDELANMAWAVERTVEGEHGLPVDRAGAAYARRPDPPAPSAEAETLAYRLRTDVPHHWLPLLPQRLEANDPSMTLRLGALPVVQPDGTPAPIRPLGRLLTPPSPDAEVVLREEEVPREGARVTRAYQLARWYDGTTFLWLGRRKAVGRGEGSSGLAFDVTE